MNKTNRLSKAVVVIVIVGIGLIQNLENKAYLLHPVSTIDTQLETEMCTYDTLQVNDNRFVKFTKSIIKSSIEHLVNSL